MQYQANLRMMSLNTGAKQNSSWLVEFSQMIEEIKNNEEAEIKNSASIFNGEAKKDAEIQEREKFKRKKMISTI